MQDNTKLNPNISAIISHKNSPASMNVITCFVCYIKTVSRLAYRTFFFTVCYSGLSVRLIKIMLL